MNLLIQSGDRSRAAELDRLTTLDPQSNGNLSFSSIREKLKVIVEQWLEKMDIEMENNDSFQLTFSKCFPIDNWEQNSRFNI